jgi:ABC-type Fe3+ transport system permease subunit
MFSRSLGDTPKIASLLLWVWIVFTSAYTLFSFAYPFIVSQTQTNALNASFQNGQLNGYNTAFGQLGQALANQFKDGCKQAIPVNVGATGAIGIVSVDCIAQSQKAQTGDKTLTK